MLQSGDGAQAADDGIAAEGTLGLLQALWQTAAGAAGHRAPGSSHIRCSDRVLQLQIFAIAGGPRHGSVSPWHTAVRQTMLGRRSCANYLNLYTTKGQAYTSGWQLQRTVGLARHSTNLRLPLLPTIECCMTQVPRRRRCGAWCAARRPSSATPRRWTSSSSPTPSRPGAGNRANVSRPGVGKWANVCQTSYIAALRC